MNEIAVEHQELFELSIDGICVLGIDGFLKKMNPAFLRIIGYTQEEIIKIPFLNLIYPDDVAKAKMELDILIGNKSHEIFDFTNRCFTKSGDIIWLSCNAKRKNDFIYIIIRDITLKMKDDMFLQLLKQTFLDSSEATSIIKIDEINNSHQVKYVNKAFLNMSGHEEIEIIKHSLDDIFDTPGEKLLNKQIITNAENEKSTHTTSKNYDKEGNKILVDIIATPVKGYSASDTYVVIERKDVTNIKLVTEQLDLKNEQYQLVLEYFEDLVLTLNEDFEIKFCTPSIKKLLGYDANEIINLQFFNFLNHLTSEELKEKLKENDKVTLETKLFKKNQEQTDVRLKIKKIAYKALSNIRYHVSITDISEEYKNARLMSTKQGLLDSVGKITKTGGWSIDLHTDEITWTDEIYEILGLSKFDDTLSIENIIAFYLPEYRPILYQSIERLRRKGIPYNLELKLLSKDNKIKHVQTIGKASYNSFGQMTRIVNTLQDITESNSNEAYRRMLESVVVNVEDAVIITDTNLDNPKILYANRAITKLTGYSIEDLLGKNSVILQGKNSSPKTIQIVKESLQRGESITTEILNYRKEGTPYWVEITISPIKGLVGEIINFVSIQRDITHSKSQKEELEDTIKKRTKELIIINGKLKNFARIASHDMKIPLRSISSFLTLFTRSIGDKLIDSELEYLKRSQTAVKDLNSLINSILAYSIIANASVQFKVIDMNQGIEQLISKYFINEIQEYSGSIEKGDFPTAIIGSETQLGQVLQNLIDNAVKFQRKGIPLKIKIVYREDADFHYFSVKDNGIGIKSNYIPQIFEPFKRLIGSDIAGHGVGLSICKEIVEVHGGSFIVISTVNVGSEFTFSISRKLKASIA
jgi:PAS domain S-box-containing protein